MPPPFQISEYATGRTYMWYVCLSEKDTPSTYNLWQRSLRRILRSADNNIITKNFFIQNVVYRRLLGVLPYVCALYCMMFVCEL